RVCLVAQRISVIAGSAICAGDFTRARVDVGTVSELAIPQSPGRTLLATSRGHAVVGAMAASTRTGPTEPRAVKVLTTATMAMDTSLRARPMCKSHRATPVISA